MQLNAISPGLNGNLSAVHQFVTTTTHIMVFALNKSKENNCSQKAHNRARAERAPITSVCSLIYGTHFPFPLGPRRHKTFKESQENICHGKKRVVPFHCPVENFCL